MAIEHTLTYNSVQTVAYSTYISGAKTYRTPTRDYEMIEIPGRNGYLLQDNNRFSPIVIEYDAFIVHDALTNYRLLINALSSDFGIHRLEDTFDPTHYRMGFFSGGIQPEIFALKTAKFTLPFTCQPERWLKTGEQQTTFTGTSGDIVNPTRFDAKPLIRVTGTGSFYISEQRIRVLENTGYIDIDCESGDAYEEVDGLVVLRNDKIAVDNHTFPAIFPGSNHLRIANSITDLTITPRWWEI